MLLINSFIYLGIAIYLYNKKKKAKKTTNY